MSVPSITRFTSTTITVSWTGAASSIVIQESPTNSSAMTTVGTYFVTSDITTYSVTYNTKTSFYYRAIVNFTSGASASTPITQYLASSGSVPGFSNGSNALNVENSESVPEIREEFGTITPTTTKWSITNANTSTTPNTGDAALFLDGDFTAPYLVMSLDPFNSGTETAVESTTSLKMPIDFGLGISATQRHESQVMTVESVSTDTDAGLVNTQPTSIPSSIVTHVQYLASTVTVFTSVPHGLIPGQLVSLYGLLDSRYNIPGCTVATVPQPTQFTITNITTGGITSQGLYISSSSGTNTTATAISSAFSNNFIPGQSIYVTVGNVAGSTSTGGYVVSGTPGLSGGSSGINVSPATLFATTNTSVSCSTIVAVPPPTTYTLASSSTSGIPTVTAAGGLSVNNILNLTTPHGLVPGMTVAITGGGALSSGGIAGSNIYTVFAIPNNIYPMTGVALQPNISVNDYPAGTLSIVNTATITGTTNSIPFTTVSGTGVTTGSIRIPTDVSAGAYAVTGFTSGSAPLTMNTTNGLAIGMPIQFSTAIGGFSTGTTYFIQAITGSTISISLTLGGGAVNTSGTSASSAISLAYAITGSTNGSALLTMNSTAGLAAGMPVEIATTTAGFIAGTRYYIIAVAATTITLGTTTVATAQNANAAGASSQITIPYVSQSNLAITGVASGVITTSTNHNLVVGNQVIFNVQYGVTTTYQAKLPYYVTSTPSANTFLLGTSPGAFPITGLSMAFGLASGNFTAYCSATCTTASLNTTGVVTLTAPANVMALNAQVVFGGLIGASSSIYNAFPYFISVAPTTNTTIQLSLVETGVQGQFTLSTSETIPSVPGQTVIYGRGYNSFPVGAIITIYGSSVLNGKQFYIMSGTGTQTLTVMPVSPTDVVPALTNISDTLIIVPTGGYRRFDTLSNRRNGSSMLLTSNTITNAQFATRYEDTRGVASVAGTHIATQTITIGTTAPSTIAATSLALASYFPTTQYNYSQQVEGITWSDFAIDTNTNTPTIRFKRNQYIPNPSRSYALRFRAHNFPQFSKPVSPISTITKFGVTAAAASYTLVTTETSHGLSVGDSVLVNGVSDSSTFTPSTTPFQITAIRSPTSFIAFAGSTVFPTVISYGGYIGRAQGARLIPGVVTSVTITGISKSQNTLTITTNAGTIGLSIGEYANLYGVRALLNGGGLPVINGVSTSVDGIYRYAGITPSASNTSYLFTIVSDLYGNLRSPVLPDFSTILVGGSIIKRTDYRLHYIRANERKRLILEPNQTRFDQSLSIPVSITNSTLSTNITGGTISTISTVNSAFMNTGIPGTLIDVVSAQVSGGTTGPTIAVSSTITPTQGSQNMFTISVSAITATGGSTYSGITGGTYTISTGPAMDVGIDESDDSGTNWYRVYDFPRITNHGLYRSPKIVLNSARIRYITVMIGGQNANMTRSITRNAMNFTDTSAITTKPPNVITDINAFNQTNTFTPITNVSLVSPLTSTFILPGVTAAASNANTILPWVNTATPTYISFNYIISTIPPVAGFTTVLIEESYDGGTTWVPFYKYPVITVSTNTFTSPKFPYTGNPLRVSEIFPSTPPSGTGNFTRGFQHLEYYENSALPNAASPNFIVDQQPAYINTNTTERTTVISPSAGTSFVVSVPISVTSATSQTFDFRIEESFDGGNTWIRLYDFGRYTFSSATSTVLTTPKLSLSGNRLRYVTSTSNAAILRAIYRWQYTDQIPSFRQFIDRSIALQTLNSTTPAYTILGAQNIQLSLSASSAAGGTLQLQGSDDGAIWVNLLGTALTVPTTAGLVTASVTNNPFQFVRGIVATTTTTPVLSYVMIKVFN